MMALKLHDKGIEVRKLQMLLNSKLLPSPRLREDGDFGRKTFDAVVRFQQQKGLTADGVVGPKTRAALGLKPMASSIAVTTASIGAPWMQIAEAELGIHEDSLPGQHNQRIVEYHQTTTLKATTDETPWCSSFVNWVMLKAGRRGTNSAAAKSWLKWGTALAVPRDGAVTVIKRKTTGPDAATGSTSGFHVAFYVGSSGGHVRLLGGNQSDQVKYSNFSLSSYTIEGYRWPV
jgi:uncharacterized protein (TIGR02594 family)